LSYACPYLKINLTKIPKPFSTYKKLARKNLFPSLKHKENS